LLAIVPNDSVAASFFFPLIQFIDSEKKLGILSKITKKKTRKTIPGLKKIQFNSNQT